MEQTINNNYGIGEYTFNNKYKFNSSYTEFYSNNDYEEE